MPRCALAKVSAVSSAGKVRLGTCVHIRLARAGGAQSRMAALEKSRSPASQVWAVFPIPLLAAP